MVSFTPRPADYGAPPKETRDAFISTPWALALIDNPKLIPSYTATRSISTYGHDNSKLFKKTLLGPDALIADQTYFRPPAPSYPHGDWLILVSLGLDLIGWAGMLHGGVLSVLLDEVTGYCAVAHAEPGMATFTAFIKVDFKRPVKLPTVLLFRAWFDPKKSKGRKIYVNGAVEDGNGVVYATAESMHMEVPNPKSNL